MNVYVRFLFFSLSALWPYMAAAQAVDIDVEIKELLQSQLGNPRNQTVELFNAMPFTNRKLSAHWGVENVDAFARSVEESSVERSNVPAEVARQSYVVRNCTSSAKPINEAITVTYIVGSTVSLTRSVTSTSTRNLNVSAANVGLTAGATDQETFSLSTMQTQKLQTTVSESRNISISIEPYTILKITAVKTSSNDYINFSAKVVVDADVFTFATGLDSRSGKEAKGRLSQLVTSEAARTIPIEGKIWNVRGRDLEIVFAEQEADPSNLLHCPKLKPTIIEDMNQAIVDKDSEIADSGAPDFTDSDDVRLSHSISPVASQGVQGVAPLVIEMTIKTSNSVANI